MNIRVPHPYPLRVFLLKTEWIETVGLTINATMDFDDLFANQPAMNAVSECKCEPFIALNILLMVVGLSLCCINARTLTRIEKVKGKNRSFKKIILSVMEAGILKLMMKNGNEDDDDHTE